MVQQTLNTKSQTALPSLGLEQCDTRGGRLARSSDLSVAEEIGFSQVEVQVLFRQVLLTTN